MQTFCKLRFKGFRSIGAQVLREANVSPGLLSGPLWSDNLVAASGLCGVWRWDVVLIVRCTSAWELHLWGSEAGWASAPLGSSGRCCADGRDAGGVSVSSGSGAEHPAPQSAGASTAEPPSPRVSAASLKILRSLYLPRSFFWFSFFISDCRAQDCESEKPPRSQH